MPLVVVFAGLKVEEAATDSSPGKLSEGERRKLFWVKPLMCALTAVLCDVYCCSVYQCQHVLDTAALRHTFCCPQVVEVFLTMEVLMDMHSEGTILLFSLSTSLRSHLPRSHPAVRHHRLVLGAVQDAPPSS